MPRLCGTSHEGAHIGVKCHGALGLDAFMTQSRVGSFGTGAHELVEMGALLSIGDGKHVVQHIVVESIKPCASSAG